MLSNQDKKEMLEMIAKVAENSKTKGTLDYQNGDWHLIEAQKFINNLRSEASSLPQDKPERKMPEIGEKYLVIEDYTSSIPFQISKTTWNGHTYDIRLWRNSRAFLISERELAEKKCAELNKILKS